MPEWLVERGIGETRAALVEDNEIVEARIDVDGIVPTGSLVETRLIDTGRAGRNAIARDDNGIEYLLPDTPSGVTEGATLTLEVVRPAIPGLEPWKRARAVRAVNDTPSPLGRLNSLEGARVRQLAFPNPRRDEFNEAGWDELVEQAASGVVRFDGGTLGIFLTPAMTLIDVDGYLPPAELALKGATEAAKAIRRLDILGSIGIDLPTAGTKEARQKAARAIDTALPRPFERTAVNGFGFVQIVRPRVRPSLIELAQDRAPFEARALLRRVALNGPGAKQLVAHPTVIAALRAQPGWLDAIARQVGGPVGLRADANLTMPGGYAEAP